MVTIKKWRGRKIMKTKEIKRIPISKKIRFEIFKRDSFKCQYCGQSAPDVLLNVDHINPVSKGGNNDLLNLVTACVECNQGKKATLISDKSVIKKQRKQIEDLNEKMEQMKMMLEWRDGLAKLQDNEIEHCIKYWKEESGFGLSEIGEKKISRYIKKYGLCEVLESMDIAIDTYCYNKLDLTEIQRAELAFNKIPGICSNRKRGPHASRAVYLLGVIKNTFRYENQYEVTSYIEELLLLGMEEELVKSVILGSYSWEEFQEKAERHKNYMRGLKNA